MLRMLVMGVLAVLLTAAGTPVRAQSANLPPLEPGDIILTRRDPRTCHPIFEITCHAYVLYNGYWMHNAIVVERDGVLQLVESTSEAGVTLRGLDSPYIAFASDVTVVRVDAPPEVRRAAADYALAQVGKPFSWRYFHKGRTDAFYCSQLAWSAYQQVGIDLDANYLLEQPLFRLIYTATGTQTAYWTFALARTTVSPDDLVRSPHTFVVERDGTH